MMVRSKKMFQLKYSRIKYILHFEIFNNVFNGISTVIFEITTVHFRN